MTPQHQSALDWAARGFPVFPCEPGGKRPLIRGGFKVATCDAGQIDQWWGLWPAANLATCPDMSGHYVIDVDPKNGGNETWEQLVLDYGDTINSRFCVRTPSGGRHYWFKGSAPSTAGALGPGIDTRGRGGYVLLPSSMVNGRPYALAVPA